MGRAVLWPWAPHSVWSLKRSSWRRLQNLNGLFSSSVHTQKLFLINYFTLWKEAGSTEHLLLQYQHPMARVWQSLGDLLGLKPFNTGPSTPPTLTWSHVNLQGRLFCQWERHLSQHPELAPPLATAEHCPCIPASTILGNLSEMMHIW